MTDDRTASLLRAAVVAVLIVLAAGLRVAPHPWNLTPIGAIALFSGAMIRTRWAAFVVPLAALLAGDVFVGLHKLMLVVYASFAVSVAIGRWLGTKRTVIRLGGAVSLGAAQFYVLTNVAAWAFLNSYPKTGAGLWACLLAGVPYFWNTLAGDTVYAAVLFGAYALAERVLPRASEHPAEAQS